MLSTIAHVGPMKAAFLLLEQVRLKATDKVLVFHHCKLTDKSIEFMSTLQDNLTNFNVEFAMVRAPYNGQPETFSEERTKQMERFDMTYLTEWAFLPEKAYLRAEDQSPELAFLPELNGVPNSYGLNALAENTIAMRQVAEQYNLTKMNKVASLVMLYAGPMNGISGQDIERVANWFVAETQTAASASENQCPIAENGGEPVMAPSTLSVTEFLDVWQQYVTKNRTMLETVIAGLSAALETEFPELIEAKKTYGDSKYATIRAAIDWNGPFVKEWQDALKMQAGSDAQLLRCRNKGGTPSAHFMSAEKASVTIPRAITKAIESLFAPFEHLALDGAAAYTKAMQLTGGHIQTLFDDHVVIALNDMEQDDVRVVNGFNSLLQKRTGRFVTAVQVSTMGDEKSLTEEPGFDSFVRAQCRAKGQAQLPLFLDEEASNQAPVRKTMQMTKLSGGW